MLNCCLLLCSIASIRLIHRAIQMYFGDAKVGGMNFDPEASTGNWGLSSPAISS